MVMEWNPKEDTVLYLSVFLLAKTLKSFYEEIPVPFFNHLEMDGSSGNDCINGKG